MSEDRSDKKSNPSSPTGKIEISRRRLLGSSSVIAASAVAATALPRTAASETPSILPPPEPPFEGHIGRTVKESTPDFPKMIEAPAGAPNILLVLTDDVGFGATSTFGGPIQTPNFQRLADSGLRYNMYHTTALCSPTRAALITGRNHHSVASGVITEFATGFPGYNSLVPPSAGSVGAVLRENGFNTSWFGKMHNVPDWMSSQAGPFDLWPNGLGFEYFYGFLGGDSDQWHPALYENTKPIEPYLGNPNYILDVDLATKRLLGCECNTRSRPTNLGSFTTQPAPRTRRIMRRKIGSRSTKDSSIRAGTRFARKRSRAKSSSALFRRIPS
jgi:Sulfatase